MMAELAQITVLTQSITYRKHRMENWAKDGMFELHEKNLKCGQFGTGTAYRNGKKIKMRTYKCLNGNIYAVMPMN